MHMLDGFKKFILRGNVVDMAVGVVIGAAFAGVVAGLTKAFSPAHCGDRREAGLFEPEVLCPRHRVSHW